MKNYRAIIITVISFLLFQTSDMLAQNVDAPLTCQEKSAVIDSIVNQLKANYVFPDIADKIAVRIEGNLKKGVYNLIQEPKEFANRLNEDLQSVSNDKHIKVSCNPKRHSIQKQTVTAEDSLIRLNNYINDMKRSNFGFKEAKILDGNIGYLNLIRFSDIKYAGETAVAAMNFLSNCDALIIDLRYNGGGRLAMIPLITSYFFDSKPVHLNSFYWRPTDSYTQTWTLPYVYGKRYPSMPVYILTSKRTFSAAEEFCYNLKNLKRATLIGETTRGGAHPGGGGVKVTDRFMIWIPTGRAINPITNTNWEGKGVIPHIEISSDKALTKAHIIAIEMLIDNNQDDELNQYYEWYLDALKVKNKPVIIEEFVIKSYTGIYGSHNVSFENNKLFLKNGNGTKYELIPMSQNEFMLKGLSHFRIRFISEKNKIVALEDFYDDGYSEKSLKVNE
ncbi:MAG: S41 family peptidase [Bacteroidales bacterium]|nr:S41 family peptidase [Bacteroidales bacterium]